MSPDRNERVRELFLAVRALDRGERTDFLQRVADGDTTLLQDVRDLLKADDADANFLESPALGREFREQAVESIVTTHEEQQLERIGPYRIEQLVGEGGFARVYAAQQETPVRRRVAIKLLKPGVATGQVIRRFEAERQHLANMDHPAIAHIFDAGTTEDGRPFFVMEYVPGVAITAYCDRERLTVSQRLELFIAVCQAIQHAHQKGIVHRDIKPSNVLVTLFEDRPTPKIIDFGIAKALDRSLGEHTLCTGVGMVVGTLGYMSPEQADPNVQDVDTRTDVYALGVLLYELLTGTTPFDTTNLRNAAVVMMQRKICEEEPPKPSVRMSQLRDKSAVIAGQRRIDIRSLCRRLRADLDWVVMRALEKDRSRRYASASELAADVTRHLQGEPLVAGPPTVRYRVGKFAHRHKSLVGGVATTILVLLAGVISTSLALQRARVAEERTSAAYRDSTDFMSNLYRLAGLSYDDGTASDEDRKHLVRRTMELAGHSADPRSQLQAYELLGQVLVWKAEDFSAACDAFGAGVEAAREADLLVSRGGVTLLNNWANTCMWTNRYEEAVRGHEELIAARQAYEREPRPCWAKDLNNLSYSLENLGRQDEAIERQREAVALRRQLPSAGDPSLGFLLNKLANLLDKAGREDDAEAARREALQLSEAEQTLDDGE